MANLEALAEAVKTGNRAKAAEITQEAVDSDVSLRQIMDAMVAAMDEVGRQFQCEQIFVPEMLIAAQAMKESMAILEPHLQKAGIVPSHRAVIGTVQGDLHDIGKNLVAMMWRGASFEVIDLGTNVGPQKFVDAAREHNADLVGLSALLTTTVPAMETTVEALRSAELESAKILVGGAPLTQDRADQMGADGYAPDAASAVEVARTLLGVST
jgi:5-methyltetrahydrofolate--homocysteine methyltransferase